MVGPLYTVISSTKQGIEQRSAHEILCVATTTDLGDWPQLFTDHWYQMQ